MKQFNNPTVQDQASASSRRHIGQSGHLVRYILATLLTLLATTSLAHAGWSTVTCADGVEMCCWVEDGVESNCHEGACRTLQGNPGIDELEEFDREKEPSSDREREVYDLDAKAESREESDGKSRTRLMEVSSEDGLTFCIDLRTMQAMDGPCPDADSDGELRRADPYEEADDEEADDEDPADADGDGIIDCLDDDDDDDDGRKSRRVKRRRGRG